VALAPDVIVANAPPSAIALQRESRGVPIVFAAVTDPVGMGIVQSLARPGGNATGFTSAEFGLSAEWLELLKDAPPVVKRVGVLRDPGNPGVMPHSHAIQPGAPMLGVELSLVALAGAGEIERGIDAFARRQRRPDRDQDVGGDHPSRFDHCAS